MALKRYGIPYKGSKNAIAEFIVDKLPPGEVFVDLFSGGCAITHCAMLQSKYKKYVVVDTSDVIVMFKKALLGMYKDEKRWISREDFVKLKDTDPYVRYCWSFGNNGRSYLYGRFIESWKKALHYKRVFNDDTLMKQIGINGSCTRIDIKNHFEEYVKKYCEYMMKNYAISVRSLESLESQERFERLCRLQSKKCTENMQSLKCHERLERIQGLENREVVKNLTINLTDYRLIGIKEASFYYADPPYKSSKEKYGTQFNYGDFEKWLNMVDKPVIVSEYGAPKGTIEIASISKRVTMSATDNKIRKDEKLFIQEKYLDWYKQQMKGKI